MKKEKSENINTKSKKEKKDVAISQKGEVSEKTFPYKKLPGLYKKSYSEKRLKKNILSKINIPQDKELLTGLFKSTEIETKRKDKQGNLIKITKFEVSKDSVYTKKELAKLKKLASEIKGNKGRIKLVSLTAVLIVIAGAGIAVNVLKNPIAKKVLKSGCEGVFGAKTDISSVNVSFTKALIRVNKIAVGNKNAEFKNLFEAEKIEVDFNLAKAFRGCFDAQNLEASGMAFNTDRTTSCALPAKIKEEKKSEEESAFVKALKEKSQTAIEDLKLQMLTMFGATDADTVDSIVEKIIAQLKTPDVSKKLMTASESYIEKYKDTPEKLESLIKNFSKSVEDLQKLDVNSINDVNVLKKDLELINSAITKSNELKSTVSKTVSQAKLDAKEASDLTKELSAAVKDDKALAEKKVNEAIDTVKNAKQIMNNALDTVAYDYLGKYYSYVKNAVFYAEKIKNNQIVQNTASEVTKISSANKRAQLKKQYEQSKKAEKKTKRSRLKGTDLYFGHKAPKFTIQRMAASGTGFNCELLNLTSNPDYIGKPLTCKADFDYAQINHGASVVVDARSYSEEPIISLSYQGKGFNVNYDGKNLAENCGIPSIQAGANISMNAAFDKGLFDASGKVLLNQVAMTSDGFGVQTVDKYYIQALSTVKNMNAAYNICYREESGIKLNLEGNFADSFTNALKSVAATLGNDVKNAVMAKVNQKISTSSAETQELASKFNELSKTVNSKEEAVDLLQKELEKKQKEIQSKITSAVNKKTNEAVNTAKSTAINKLKDFANSN